MKTENRLIDADVSREKTCKTVTHFARIIVGGSVEKPYYSIIWFDRTDREYHIGYSSYDLGFVSKWLSEEFEIVSDAFLNEPVVHGRWIHCDGKSIVWYCSECGGKILYNPNPRTYNIKKLKVEKYNKFCRNCGAKMDGGAD